MGKGGALMILFEILYSVILPVFLIIGVGVVLDRCFTIDLPTLSKLNFYVFVPALVMVKLLDADLPADTMLKVGGFGIAHVVILFAISLGAYSWGSLKAKRAVLSLATMFYNTGNYGFPFVILAFGDEYVGIIAILLMTQNLLNFTLGIWILEGSKASNGSLLKIPILYVLAIALAMRALGLDLVPSVKQPLTYLGNGLIPIALLTLGVQLSRCKISREIVPLSVLTVIRLVVSPVIGWGLVTALGIEGVTGAVLIASAGLPVAVNVFILAAEYNRDAELASQGVFWTTLLSPVTLAVVLMLVR